MVRKKRRVLTVEMDEVLERKVNFLRHQVHGGRLKAAISQAVDHDCMGYGYLDWVARLDSAESPVRQRKEQLV